MLIVAEPVFAKDLRLALWHAPLSREGPGLLYRDIQRADPAVLAMARHLAEVDADILVLTQFDYDATGAALGAFSRLIDRGYDHILPLRSNAGIPTGRDLDGDGRLNEPEDAQAYGRFPGQEALAVLSRHPILAGEARSFNDLLWQDAPGSHATPSDTGIEVQRLSSGGHWIVPVEVGAGDGAVQRIDLLVGHAGPPVFDGPEDRNGRRNLDELRLWDRVLDTDVGPLFVFMANTNLDPDRGEGYRDAMAGFLARPDLTDPLPGRITAGWDRPGPMRVSYLLPSRNLALRDAQVWPGLPDQPHHLISVDITVPAAGPP